MTESPQIKPKSAWLLAICCLAAVLLAIILPSSTTHATTLPVVNKFGILMASETWTPGYVYHVTGVTVPDGVSLTIEPGAIIKADTYYSAITIQSGGSVDASGTVANPITFTSWRDDAPGGDSNGDGIWSEPSQSDTDAVLVLEQGASASLTHVETKFARHSVQSNHAVSLLISDSILGATVSINDTPSTAYSVLRNTFTESATYGGAVSLSSSDPGGLRLEGTDANIFTGMGSARTVQIYNSTVPLGGSWTISSTNNAVVLLRSLRVEGALTVLPGSIVKTMHNAEGINVQANGSLAANGTLTNPIYFTSYKDDTVGGDSGGDGTGGTYSTPSYSDYQGTLTSLSGAVVEIDHAEFRYGYSGMTVYPSQALVTVSHSVFQYARQSIQANCSSGANLIVLQIIDNNIDAPVSISSCGYGSYAFERNTFGAMEVAQAGSLAAWVASSEVSHFPLTGINKNTFTGMNSKKVLDVSNSTLREGESWAVPSGNDVILGVSRIDVDGSLQIAAGAIVKTSGNTVGAKINVQGEGSISASGSLSDPIVFTSIKDDSVGGDSNGSSSTPSVNDSYTLIDAQADTEIFMQHAYFHYTRQALAAAGDVSIAHAGFTSVESAAAFSSGSALMQDVYINGYDGLLVSGDARVTFRGTFDVEHMAVQSCDWPPLYPLVNPEDLCAVDVTYSKWGDPTGPFPPSGKLVCGVMTTSPWKYSNSTYSGSSIFGTGNCSNSTMPNTEAGQRMEILLNAYETAQDDCTDGLEEACDTAVARLTCFEAIANSVGEDVPWTMPPASSANALTEFIGLVDGTVTSYFEDNALEFVFGDNATLKRDLATTAISIGRLGNAANTCSSLQ